MYVYMKPLYTTDVLIHFRDADPQGILYFSRVYDLAHNCLEEFWSKSPLGWRYWFQNPEFAVPLRHSACEYFRPMQVGDTYRSKLTVAKIGESSVEFICEFTQRDTGTVYTRVSTTHVFVDKKTFTKINVPERVRLIFQ